MVINKVDFPLYGLIIILAIITGMIYIYKSLRRDGYNDKNISLYFLLYIVFALFMGKMYTAIITGTFDFPKATLSSYGGLIGVMIASIIFEMMLPLNKQLIKYTALSLPLVYGISKIACFISGCCYGIPFKSIISVTYPDRLNIELFPIQIVETISFLILFFICNRFKNNKYITYIVLSLSVILKFLLDFLRYSHIKEMISSNQIVSMILLVIVIGIFLCNKIRKINKI